MCRSTKHAGENLAEVLKQRAAELPPLTQMSDALSRNVPKLPAGVEMLLARCLAHGRRQFVEVAQNFPDQCRYVLETLGEVYGYDTARRGWTVALQVREHQEHQGQSTHAGGAVHNGGPYCRFGLAFRSERCLQVPASVQ